MNKYKSNDEFDEIILNLLYTQKKTASKGLTYSQKLRIIILYLRSKLSDPDSISKIIFFSELEENSPYVLARELNKKEINHLTEFSRFFSAYLQIHSYEMYNYYQKEKSFTFSLELLFVMKYLLLSNYEEFIFTTLERSDEYAYNASNENITVINEGNLFGNDYIILKQKLSTEQSKNLAFPISFEFRHEKNAYEKRYNKNSKNFSPFVFYRNGKIERIEEEKKINNICIKKGERGRIIESFLTPDKSIIYEFKKLHIFGELLDYKYFVDKDFSELLKKMKEIKEKNGKKMSFEKKDKNDASDKIEIYQEEKDENISELYADKLEKEGIIKFGDLHYTKGEFDKIMNNLKKNKEY